MDALLPKPTGGGSGGKIQGGLLRPGVTDRIGAWWDEQNAQSKERADARRVQFAQENNSMLAALGLGNAAPPPAQPPGSEAPLQTVNIPNVPSNEGPSPEERGSMIQAFMSAMPGATQVRRGPGITPAAMVDPDVQAQLQRPEVQAAMAPSAGDITFGADAFLEAPEGEAGLENFLFREIAVMGPRAPQAIQSGWLQMQTAKRQRLGARADYLSGLIKDRFRADLERRNAGDTLQAQDGWRALDRITNVRSQEALLDLQTRIANANLLEQYKGRLSAQQVETMRQTLGAGEMDVKRADRLYKSTGYANASVKAMSAGTRLVNYMREIMGSTSVGLGDLSQAINRVKQFAGNEQAQRLRMLINEVNQTAIAAYAEKAGMRGVDTKPEQDFLKSTNPAVGVDMNVSNEWLNRIQAVGMADLKSTFEYMNNLKPGAGSKLNREMAPVLRAMAYGQAAAAAQLESENGITTVNNFFEDAQ
jgi:hypothetical protein